MNPMRAGHCRLCFLLLYQKQPTPKSCPVLLTKCCGKPFTTEG